MNPKNQSNQYQNPWPIWTHLVLFIWKFLWVLLCSWTPKVFNPWRLLVLKIFGARISGMPFVHQRARIQITWHLKMHNRACLGERTNAYSLGNIEILEGATIAQEAYLCTGTHDINSSSFQLITQKITIQPNAFVGARAMILPGVSIGNTPVVGPKELETNNVKHNEIFAGNPARKIGNRTMQ